MQLVINWKDYTEDEPICAIYKKRVINDVPLWLYNQKNNTSISFHIDCAMGDPKDQTEIYLKQMAESLEPITHCCECTPGPHFERHMVHIQYPDSDCKCDKANYVLKRNEL